MKDIIVIPTYNERENIQILIPEILSHVPQVHIYVVDDSSPDGTADVVREMMQHYKNVSLHVRTKKEGLGSAYKDILSRIRDAGDARLVIAMDADGSHDPAYLPTMIERIQTHDFVVGSRYVKGGGVGSWSMLRRLLSMGGNIYARALVGIGVRDLTAGFIAIRGDLLSKIHFDSISASGYAYQMEMKYHCIHTHKATVCEIPIVFRERREGESKLSSHIIREGVMVPVRIALRRWTSK